MENKKTISSLNNKPWYRALKVLNLFFIIGCYLVGFASIIAVFIGEDVNVFLKILYIPWAVFWAWLISKIPQWIFYYIVLGSIYPEK